MHCNQLIDFQCSYKQETLCLVNAKLNQLMESLRDISENDRPYFKENAESFLYTAYNHLTFSRRIRDKALPGDNIDTDKTIREFKAKIKEPFFNALLTEISDGRILQIKRLELLMFLTMWITVQNFKNLMC